MEKLRKQIGQDLKARRLADGYSRYAISKIINLSITQIKSIEDGAKSYTIDSLLLYANILGYDVSITTQAESEC